MEANKREDYGAVKLAVRILVTVVLLGFGVFVLVTADWQDNPEFAAAATGWIGFVAGYWLR